MEKRESTVSSVVHGTFTIEREMDFRVGSRERGTGSLMDALARSLET